MSKESIQDVFKRLQNITTEDGQNGFIGLLKSEGSSMPDAIIRKKILQKIIKEIDNLAIEIKKDSDILVSVKNQKLLRTCFQLITVLGVSPCLIPGLGVSLLKRSATVALLPPPSLNDEEKYELLVKCTLFFTRCYTVPVLKNIIITFHLCDYLAALMQLSFAPLKKPGVYNNFTMTEERYGKLNIERNSFIRVYNYLVANCFQPILMKELLVLQAVTDPSPPAFVKRVIAKEMSNRLLSQGGLLSLIRCFIESYNIDSGYEWKKIDMICKIVSLKHGVGSESDYLDNICMQLQQIMLLNNTHYLTTAVACALSLNEKYPQSETVKHLIDGIFKSFDQDYLGSKTYSPGTLVLSPQEVEHNLYVLDACMNSVKLNWPIDLMTPNLYLLFQIGMICSKHQELKIKVKDVIIKCLAACGKEEVVAITKTLLFGNNRKTKLSVEEFDAGMAIKYVDSESEYPRNEAFLYYLELFKASDENMFVETTFEVSLKILVDLTEKRRNRGYKDLLLVEDNSQILDDIDQQYALTLQLLSEISTSPKVMSSLKKNTSPVLDFIEYFLLKNYGNSTEECVTIALVLLNTLLSNSEKATNLDKRYIDLIPVLRKMAEDTSSFNSILCKEAVALISLEQPKAETACERAIANVFDNLLPVRAHGIIELTKLIDSTDPETISKKHYIFCLFQEQLKDVDSYIYLASINGIAALGTQCPEDVLQVLCKEFLLVSSEHKQLESQLTQDKMAELRMKVGDVIVKVTKRLGEMAIVHKTILLNTMLCACRDEDPLIRTSALSNLAEIALILHYRIGSIIYEMLLCIWSILETDKAIECRRAAVMIISSLLKGLGRETLIQLKENLLPVYRTLKKLYNDPCEDSVLKLHAQVALEELNEIVTNFLFPEVEREKQIFLLDTPENVFK